MAFVIDGVILFVVAVVATVCAALAAAILLPAWTIDSTLAAIENGSLLVNLMIYAVTGLAMLAWYGGWESGAGATPGMLLCKLRVLNPRGDGKPSLLAAVVRNCPQVLLSFGALTGDETIDGLLSLATLVVYLGIGISIGNSPTHQGFHDRLAGGTYVVRRNPAGTPINHQPIVAARPDPLVQGLMRPTVR